jgi:hypothetical protein
MLAYVLVIILVVPISWLVSFVLSIAITTLLRKLISLWWLQFLNGLIEGFIAFGIARVLFRWLQTPFSFAAVIIVGVEFGLLYFHGIVGKQIRSEIPLAIGTMAGLFLLPLLLR